MFLQSSRSDVVDGNHKIVRADAFASPPARIVIRSRGFSFSVLKEP